MKNLLHSVFYLFFAAGVLLCCNANATNRYVVVGSVSGTSGETPTSVKVSTESFAAAEALGSDSYASLTAALAGFANGDVVLVKAGTYYITAQLAPKRSTKMYGGFKDNSATLTTRLTDGNLTGRYNFAAATIIDGGDVTRCLSNADTQGETTGDQMVIDGFTFQYGKVNSHGGGVYIRNKTKLVRCKVINNVSIQYGGGVYAYAANSSDENASLYYPTIDSCLVSRNSVVPETSYTRLGGGGIYAVNKSVINNTDIVNNRIDYSAKNNGTFSIHGGGVFLSGTSQYFTCFLHEMDNCNISGNSISASNATTETGTTCTANALGGGISLYGRSGFTMRNSVVQNNTVTAYADTREALFENATLTVAGDGGGIFLPSMSYTDKGWAYTLENVRVSDNTCTTSYSNLSGGVTATLYGGGVYCGSGLTMTGCEVSGNHLFGNSTSCGGGLCVSAQNGNRNINISNSSFRNNSLEPSALGRSQGGGLYVSNSYGSTVLTNLTVENNSISSTYAVRHNKQTVAGGGLYCSILDTVPAVQVIGGSYSGNTITGSTATSVVGGGICSLKDIILKNVKIQRNRLVGYCLDGAGFYHTGSVATLENCVIGGDTYADGNSAGGTYVYGAGIMVYLGQIEMSNTKVRFNHGTSTGSSYGGGVNVSPNSVSYCDSKLTDCVISDNALYTGAYAYGGGMYITGYKLTLKNTVFERDTLSAVTNCYGGGLNATGSVTADNCDFNANVLVKGTITRGAGVYSGTTRVVVKDIPYYFNEQTYTNCRVKDNRMEDNFTSTRSGGGMFLVSSRMLSESVTSRISVLDSEIAGNKILTTTNNKIYSCGGGICALAYYPLSFNPAHTDSISYINVERCMFRDNEISAYSSGYSYGSAFSMLNGSSNYCFCPVYTFNNNLVFNNSGANTAVYICPKSVCNNTLFNNKDFDKSATTGNMHLYAYKPGTAPWASSIVANNIVWGPTGASIGGTAGQTNLPVKNNYVTGDLPAAAVFAVSGNINTSVTAAAAFRSTDMSEYHYDDEEELLIPAPGSPFVGAGYDDTGVTDSYFGDVRPKHGTPAHYDIGALPYMPGATLTVKTNNAYGTVDVRDKANTSRGTAAYGSDYEEDISPIKSRTLTASIGDPNDGYYFGGWNDGETDNPRRISFTVESEYTALFKPVCDTVVVSYKDTVANGSYDSVDVKVKGTETVRHTFGFSASEVRDAYKTETGADYPSDGVFRFTGSMGYVAPVYVMKDITIKNSRNVDSVARVALCVAPAYHCDETKIPKDIVYNAVYDYHGVKNHGSWTGLDGENKKDWDISATLTSSLGADSTYTSTVVLKMEESGDEAMYIISWSRDLLKRTVSLRLSLWGQDLNAADGYGYGAKFYINGSEEITEFTDNKDRTVTLLIPESEIKAGQKMLKITLRDAGTAGTPVRSVRYYDVPVMLPRATSDKVDLSADVDMWVYSNGTTTVNSTVTVRNVYINEGATLSVTNNSTLTVSGSLYIRCDAAGSAVPVKVGDGSKIALPTTAGAVKFVRIVNNKQWYMMSLPFDCDFADIRKSPEVGGNTTPTNQDTYGSKKGPELLIKQYSAVRRAETYQTEEDAKAHNRWWWAGTRENPGPQSHIWDTVATTATIPACHGFEITTNTPYYREIIFSSKALTNGRMQYQSSTSIPVKYYNDDQQTWNIHYGWNLIGLPSFQSKPALKTISLDDASDPEKNNWGVYVFDATNRVWNDYDGHTIEMSPFQAYLVQIRDDGETDGADHNIILNGAGGDYAKTVLSAPQATRTAQTEPLTFSLLLGEDTLYDRTTFHIHDKYSTDYEIGYDRLKLLSGDALAPQFFSIAPKGEMSHNALPVEAAKQPIQLGFTLPEPGNSTITLFGIKDTEADAIWLHDRQENVTVNLFDGPYEFYSSVTSDYTRFTLNVQPLNSPDDYQHSGEATGVDEPKGTSFSALSSKADGVYDVLGRKVAELSADRQATDLLPTGVYVIVKNGEARKEVIR